VVKELKGFETLLYFSRLFSTSETPVKAISIAYTGTGAVHAFHCKCMKNVHYYTRCMHVFSSLLDQESLLRMGIAK
jgi:hypothetical protein